MSVEITSEESQSEAWAVGPLLVSQANGTMIIDSSSGLEEDSFYSVALTVSNRCKTVLKSHSISEYYRIMTLQPARMLIAKSLCRYL